MSARMGASAPENKFPNFCNIVSATPLRSSLVAAALPEEAMSRFGGGERLLSRWNRTQRRHRSGSRNDAANNEDTVQGLASALREDYCGGQEAKGDMDMKHTHVYEHKMA